MKTNFDEMTSVADLMEALGTPVVYFTTLEEIHEKYPYSHKATLVVMNLPSNIGKTPIPISQMMHDFMTNMEFIGSFDEGVKLIDNVMETMMKGLLNMIEVMYGDDKNDKDLLSELTPMYNDYTRVLKENSIDKLREMFPLKK